MSNLRDPFDNLRLVENWRSPDWEHPRDDQCAASCNVLDVSSLSHKGRKRIAILQKRSDFLSQRFSEAESEGRELTYDKSEHAAINRAIARIIALEEENAELRSQAGVAAKRQNAQL